MAQILNFCRGVANRSDYFGNDYGDGYRCGYGHCDGDGQSYGFQYGEGNAEGKGHGDGYGWGEGGSPSSWKE